MDSNDVEFARAVGLLPAPLPEALTANGLADAGILRRGHTSARRASTVSQALWSCLAS